MPRRRFSRLLLAAALTACLGALASAPSALAHAQLLGTSPESASTVATQPREVIFKYNQNVGGTLGAVRVYDARGEEVDNLDVINFPLSLAIPGNATGKALEFRTLQTYSNGQIVHWIEHSLTAEHPSPRINVTAKGGLIEEVAGDEAGPEAGQASAAGSTRAASNPTAKPSGGASRGLAITALILGALGLLAGLAALAVSRRNSPA